MVASARVSQMNYVSERFQSIDTKELFFESLGELSRFPPESYFVYGSSAIDARNGLSGQLCSCSRLRVENLQPALDIDVAFYEDTVPWEEIAHLSEYIRRTSNGAVLLDPHYVEVRDNDFIVIKGMTIPRDWFTTVAIGTQEVSVLEPVPSILMRCLHRNIRAKDTKRIIAEIKNLSKTELHDIRLSYGISLLVSEYRRHPGKLAQQFIKFILGFLPNDVQQQISLYIRGSGYQAGLLLDSEYPRPRPVYL